MIPKLFPSQLPALHQGEISTRTHAETTLPAQFNRYLDKSVLVQKGISVAGVGSGLALFHVAPHIGVPLLVFSAWLGTLNMLLAKNPTHTIRYQAEDFALGNIFMNRLMGVIFSVGVLLLFAGHGVSYLTLQEAGLFLAAGYAPTLLANLVSYRLRQYRALHYARMEQAQLTAAINALAPEPPLSDKA